LFGGSPPSSGGKESDGLYESDWIWVEVYRGAVIAQWEEVCQAGLCGGALSGKTFCDRFKRL
jgi:hypothetical protein